MSGPVRDIAEEMVEAAVAGLRLGYPLSPTAARQMARTALSAALTGRTVVELPDPAGVDDDDDTWWEYPGGKAWSRARGRFDESTAARFRGMALAILASVEHNEKLRQARESVSQKGGDTNGDSP